MNIHAAGSLSDRLEGQPAQDVRTKLSVKGTMMEIQVNSGSNIEGVDELARRVEEEIETVLGRFSDQITRVEVHLNDENADKTGGADKRCLIEARLAGRDPEAVTHTADSIEQAYTGAAKKLRRVLDARIGKLNDHKGGETIRRADQ